MLPVLETPIHSKFMPLMNVLPSPPNLVALVALLSWVLETPSVKVSYVQEKMTE